MALVISSFTGQKHYHVRTATLESSSTSPKDGELIAMICFSREDKSP